MSYIRSEREKLFWLEPVLIALTFFAFILAISIPMNRTAHTETSTVLLNSGWYYLQEGKKIEVSLPCEIQVSEGESLTLYNDSLRQEDAGQGLLTRAGVYEPVILWQKEEDGQLLYEYSEEDFPRNEQMKAKLDCMAQLPSDLAEGKLAVIYHEADEGVYRIPEIYLGDQEQIIQMHYQNSAVVFVIVVMMLFLSAGAFVVSLYLRHIHMSEPRFFDTGLFLLLCAAWCLLDSGLVQTKTSIAACAGYISFYAFMLLALPMLHFMKNTLLREDGRILNAYLAAFYVNAIAQGIIHFYFGVPLIRMLFISQLLLFTGVIIISVLLVREYKNGGAREIIWYLTAFLLVGGSGIGALLLYWVFKISFYDIIFDVGVLIFVFVLMFGLIVNITENFRFKTETLIYQRLAGEDSMTGMKNRRGFEKDMNELKEQIETYANVALLFVKTEGLRTINDRYGQNAGDELILAAARCVESTFQGKGVCYRLSGDEFCVLLPNPEENSKDWYERLDFEIESHNNSSNLPYKLSLRKGLAYLRNDDGSIKSFSQWKYQANQNMYSKEGRTPYDL